MGRARSMAGGKANRVGIEPSWDRTELGSNRVGIEPSWVSVASETRANEFDANLAMHELEQQLRGISSSAASSQWWLPCRRDELHAA